MNKLEEIYKGLSRVQEIGFTPSISGDDAIYLLDLLVRGRDIVEFYIENEEKRTSDPDCIFCYNWHTDDCKLNEWLMEAHDDEED